MARYVLRQPVYDQIREFLAQHGREDLLAGALELTEINDPGPPDGEEADDDDYGDSIHQEAVHDH